MWVERLARFGYAAKGVVYAVIGILAVQAALGWGGETTGTTGALHAIARQPFGKALLAVIAVGLLGYVIWRFVEAIKDPEHEGNDAKGIVKRIGYAISGIIYIAIAWTAAQLAFTVGGANENGDTQQEATAWLLSQPFGQWLVATVGALVIGLGFYKFYKAYSVKFRRQLKVSQMSPKEETWAIRISRFGIAARGVVFTLIGIFLIQAALQARAEEVKGLDEVLQAIAQQPLGKFLLAIVALGLIAYGIYMGVQARYRRIQTT
ncbi:MAG: DUF1206 domain-containing protein [Chroococcales cyanobacterium]